LNAKVEALKKLTVVDQGGNSTARFSRV
jgi:hypothetical protein